MGKLALWGAVGGVAKGMQANIEMEQKKELMNLDEARTKRILQMQQEHQSTMQASGQAHAEKMQDTQIGAQKEMQQSGFEHATGMQDDQQTFQQGMQDDEQKFTGEENDKNRATTLEAAHIRATATGASKRGRWEFSKMKETRTMEGGVPGEFEVPVVRDRTSGANYIQRGDRFMLPDDNPASIKRAPPAAVQELLRNGNIDAFVEMYRYIPYVWMSHASAGAGSASESDTEE